MITKTKSNRPSARQARFLELLPLIQKMAQQAFQDYGAEEREELNAQVVANCWAAFVELMDRGKEDVIYATPLARYAIRRVRDGRALGCKQNVYDVSSPCAQRQLGVLLDRLDRYRHRRNQWRQILVEDRRVGPAETAASRIDFADWLRRLPATLRGVAELLGAGETTGTTARQFKLPSVSSIRAGSNMTTTAAAGASSNISMRSCRRMPSSGPKWKLAAKGTPAPSSNWRTDPSS